MKLSTILRRYAPRRNIYQLIAYQAEQQSVFALRETERERERSSGDRFVYKGERGGGGVGSQARDIARKRSENQRSKKWPWLGALELTSRSGIRRVYYREGKLPGDSGSGFRYRGFVQRSATHALSLSLSLSLSLLPSRRALARAVVAQDISFSPPVLSLVSAAARLSLKDTRDTERRMERRAEQRKSTRWENSPGAFGRREPDREKRAEDNITSGTSHKTIQDSLPGRADVSKLLQTSSLRPHPANEETLRRQICQSHPSLSLSLSLSLCL